jgi:translation initiation factor 2 alpha subunit (eIF-2alpha)
MPKSNLEEGQLVLCTVTKVAGTIVFVAVEEYNAEGTITFPEIAPGRIRNIRDFVFPGKKIVCKVLRIKPGSLELSLRRVKVSERNELNERVKKERSYNALLKTLLGENAEKIIAAIKEKEGSLFDLMDNAREKPELLAKYLPKEATDKIAKVLSEKKAKETTISKKFSLSSKAQDGILIVKSIITDASKGISPEISYVAAGKYLVKIRTKDLKQADSQLNKMMQAIEALAKKQGCAFNVEK